MKYVYQVEEDGLMVPELFSSIAKAKARIAGFVSQEVADMFKAKDINRQYYHSVETDNGTYTIWKRSVY